MKTTARVSLIPQRTSSQPEGARPLRGTLVRIEPDGRLLVDPGSGPELACEWLQTSADSPPALESGDSVLVLWAAPGIPVVVGRIGRYRHPGPRNDLCVEAKERLSLKCGDASIELRADGKLLVKGEDVLVKARGTQRIKAGSVNIN